jgi:hypothetical protein
VLYFMRKNERQAGNAKHQQEYGAYQAGPFMHE